MGELKEKIMKIIREPHLASLATITEDGKPWTRYVFPNGSGDMSIRFSSFLDSRKVAQIRKNPEVHLTCGVTDPQTASSYLQIQGRAEITSDEAERKAYWKEELKRYFSGPDDPNYCIVIVKPYRIEYMDMTSPEPRVWEA
jgi:general stress protein 26